MNEKGEGYQSALANAAVSQDASRSKPLPENISQAMHEAVHWFHRQGGDGVATKDGRILARGECPNFEPATFVRLEKIGFIEKLPSKRWFLKVEGYNHVKEFPLNKARPHGALRNGKVDRLPDMDGSEDYDA